MKYNLATHSQTISNTSVGDIELTTDEVISVISTTAADVAMPTGSGTVSGTLVLDCDLGSRVHSDQVRYHYRSTAPVATVTSGITFSYKNEDFELYTDLNTYYDGAGYWYTLISGTDAPRYIRVTHTVISGAGGYLDGLEVLNDDAYVDFGEDGNRDDFNINLSLENALVQTSTMFIYNSGPIRANAKIVLEPQDTVADDILTIAENPDGPWYGIYRPEDLIASDGIWDSGAYDDTYDDAGTLKLSAGKTSGTYRARIIKLDDYQRLTRSIIQRDYPVIVSEVAFFDDFSDGGIQWDVVTESYVDITFNNFLNIYDLQSNPDSGSVSTKYNIEYGDDWMMTFKFRWPYVYYGPTYGGASINFSDRFFLRFSPGTNHYNGNPAYDIFDLFINNSQAFDWRDTYGTNWPRNNLDTWYDFKFQREFSTMRFKFWKSGDAEPDWMYTKVLDNPSDIDLSGKFGMQVENMSVTRNTSLDNIKVIKNYSASADSKSIIATDDIDTLENIEVRSSNSEPMDRLTYIELGGSSDTKITQHRWMADGSIAEQSADWGTWGTSGNYFEYWYDSVTEREFIVDKSFYTGYYGDTEIWFRIRQKSGSLVSSKISDGDYDYSCYWSTYKLSPNSAGGFWVYFYLSRNGASGGSYYFDYWTSSLSRPYRRSATAAQGTFLYDLDAVYDSTDVWYTDRELSTVFRINNAGTIQASYLATNDVRGLFALPDGGCWFIQGAVLQRIDGNGNLIEVIDIPSDTASYVYSDGEDGFWLHDGYVVRHLNSDGTETFNIDVPDLYFIIPFKGGVLTKHGSGTSTPKAGYISKVNKRMVREWNYPRTEGTHKGTFDYNRYGVREHTYDDLVDDHASNFPIAIDTQWNNIAEWRKVSLRDYNFTNEEYHQLRITLRADSSANSPEVHGLYTQRAIEIPNIYPNNWGKYYLKADVQYLNPDDTGDYTSKIKSYWFLDAE